MTAVSGEQQSRTVAQPVRPRAFRADIQGLRAIAVLLVVLYHAEVFGVSAGFVGVDVFFVISGYLITRHLAKEIRDHGRPQLVAFYANRIRRLVPAATVTLLGTVLLTVAFLPVRRWGSVADDVVGSALNYENWRLAHTAVNYLSQDEAASPLQHFWSLAVEEQFYLGWPIALVVLALLLRRFDLRALRPAHRTGAQVQHAAVVGAALLIGLPSLAFSVVYTAVSPSQAYFVTPTRLWELAAGGVLCVLTAPASRLRPAVAGLVSWVGLGIILVSSVTISPAEPYPGAVALLPVVGALLVIVGGEAQSPYGAGRLLDLPPLRFLGDISYSLYLWHWPILVVARATFDTLSPVVAVVAVALAIAVSYLCYRFVENPFRSAPALLTSRRKAVALGAVCVVLSLVAGQLLARAFVDARSQVQAREAVAGAPIGAGAVLSLSDPAMFSADTTAAGVVPDPITAAGDWPGCVTAEVKDSAVRRCDYGDPTSSFHVALVGDSHAKQWITAYQAEAERRHWRLTAYIHDACPFATGDLLRGKDLAPEGTAYTPCRDWNAALQQELAGDPDLHLLITANYGPSAYIDRGGRPSTPAMAEALRAAWEPFLARGIRVLVMRDNPAPLLNVPDCVARHPNDLGACTVSTADATRDSGTAQVLAANGVPGVTLLDLNWAICPGTVCPPVIGGALVYRDGNHLTATYVRSLQPLVSAAVDRVTAS